jgi:uncharacterized repeat protein (TIGR03803 family)
MATEALPLQAWPWGQPASPGSLILKDGILYGTTATGGAYGGGTVFQLEPGPSPAPQPWIQTILFSFNGSTTEGFAPFGPLAMGGKGELVGTTSSTMFELVPPSASGPPWTEVTLHVFTGANGDGSGPIGGLLFDPSGTLYGVTEAGGAFNLGTLYAIKP